jgi:hypothetical protein
VGEAYRWPTIQGRLLDTIGKPSGLAAKLFIEMTEGQIVLADAKGAEMQMRWPLTKIPLLGLWINESGWSGAALPPYCNAGIEPTTSAPDDLALAQEWGYTQTLLSGAEHIWWLEVSLKRKT